jgi:NADH dehydrogenase FAD-containing subunit
MSQPRLVVLGAGFAGYSLLRELPRGLFDATLVTPRNYFLFTPLLPSATVGTVELRSILEPVRRRLRHMRLFEALAEEIDWQRRLVRCCSAVSEERFEVPYDLLVLAVGARVADLGIPGVREHCLTLATIPDARAIRSRVLAQLASAEVPGLPEEELRRRLTFVVCGGGPTGVEVAAEIHDLLTGELRTLYPELAPYFHVSLLEALERLLGGFDEALGTYTRRHFAREGIEVRTGVPVARVEPRRLVLEDGDEVPFGMAIWAGGNAPVPLLEGLGIELVRGRLPVAPDLAVPERTGVWAAGDCAAVGEPPLPATAQIAQQQGKYLARLLRRRARGLSTPPFVAKSAGMMAYIGGGEALADLPRVKWSGRGAWLLWRSAYLTKLVSLPNKVKVLFDWIKAAAFGRDVSRF